MSAKALTIVTAAGSLAKHVTVIDGGVTRADDPFWPRLVTFETVVVDAPDDLLDVLSAAAEYDPAPCVVRAEPLADMGRRAIYDDPEKGPAGMRPVPRAWVGYDIEKVPAEGIDPLREPERAVAQARRCLPPQHHDTTVVWQITASAGKRLAELRLRLWFLFDQPLFGRQVAAWCKPGIDFGWLDPCTLRNEVLPHFIAVKVVGDSLDPCPQRWGIVHGERDRVPVPNYVASASRHQGHPSKRGSTIEGGDLEELRAHYGPRLVQRQHEAVAQIRAEVEATKAASTGARHPTYLRAAAIIMGLCKYWCIPVERPRELLVEAYLSTLTPDEARRRERGSIEGVWAWLERETDQPEQHPAAELLQKLRREWGQAR